MSTTVKTKTNNQPTSPANLARINAFYFENENLVRNLYGRWLDEGQYEDISEYAKVFSKALKKHKFIFVKVTKKPFGFTFKIDENSPVYTIKITTTKYQWCRTF